MKTDVVRMSCSEWEPGAGGFHLGENQTGQKPALSTDPGEVVNFYISI